MPSIPEDMGKAGLCSAGPPEGAERWGPSGDRTAAAGQHVLPEVAVGSTSPRPPQALHRRDPTLPSQQNPEVPLPMRQQAQRG